MLMNDTSFNFSFIVYTLGILEMYFRDSGVVWAELNPENLVSLSINHYKTNINIYFRMLKSHLFIPNLWIYCYLHQLCGPKRNDLNVHSLVRNSWKPRRLLGEYFYIYLDLSCENLQVRSPPKNDHLIRTL